MIIRTTTTTINGPVNKINYACWCIKSSLFPWSLFYQNPREVTVSTFDGMPFSSQGAD